MIGAFPPRSRALRLRSWRLPFVALFVALASGAAPGCSKPDAPTEAAAPAVLAPVPAPDGLMAEVFVPSPEATWGKARIVAGGAALFLPKGLGALASALFGLPITSAGEIDAEVPMLGAIVEGKDGKRPSAVLGLHVKAGGRLVEQLTLGPAPRFKARVDAATGVTLLEPVEGKATSALGVLGNYLLVGGADDDLTRVGPYVVRTMPAMPVTKDDVAIEMPAAALSGPIERAVTKLWAGLRGAAARDGAPGLGGVVQALLGADTAVAGALEVLGDLDRATLTLNLESGASRARLSMKPKAGSGPASAAASSLALGDAKPLLGLPKDTLAALLVRESAASRTAGAAARVRALSALLGKDAAAIDPAALEGPLGALSQARGDWTALGLTLGPTGPAGYARAPVTDAGAITKATKALWDLAQTAPVKARLAEAGASLSRGKTVLEGMPGDVERWRFTREKKAPAGAKKAPVADASGEVPDAVDLLFRVKTDEVLAATGYDARGALRRLLEVSPESSLGSSEEIRAAIDALGGDVAAALVLEPLAALSARAGRPGTAESAPVVLALGRGAAEGGAAAPLVVRLDVANAALRALMKGGGGL